MTTLRHSYALAVSASIACSVVHASVIARHQGCADPINEGWLVRIEMDTEKELANLMRAPEYKKLIQA